MIALSSVRFRSVLIPSRKYMVIPFPRENPIDSSSRQIAGATHMVSDRAMCDALGRPT